MAKRPQKAKKSEPTGAPAYMTTFADLMSLLMCFFVLMLSFSEMDRQKFKIMAGSFKEAFGVQRKVKVWDLPKGISIVALNFNDPNFSEMNLIYEIRSAVKVANIGEKEKGENKLASGDKGETETWLSENRDLKLGDHKEGNQEPGEKSRDGDLLDEGQGRDLPGELGGRDGELGEDYQDRYKLTTEELWNEVKVTEDEKTITVTFPEKVLFDSGSSKIRKDARPLMSRFHSILLKYPNKVMVVGHTDNVPIKTAKFPSNWELSAARSGSIIRYFLGGGNLDPGRFTAIGKADTAPAADNDTPPGRAKNRRVELVFEKKVALRNPSGKAPIQPIPFKVR